MQADVTTHYPLQSAVVSDTANAPGVASLRSFGCHHTNSNDHLSNLVSLMAAFFGVPMASVSLIDEDIVSVKASIGFPRLYQRKGSLCTLIPLQNEPLVIEDAQKQAAPQLDPSVHGEKGIRFYASAPLVSEDGIRVGAVCIADNKPRKFSAEDCTSLVRFASMVMHEFEMKAIVAQRNVEISEKERQLKEAFAMSRIGTWEYDVLQQEVTWSDELFQVYGLTKTDTTGNLVDLYLSLLHPEDLPRALKEAAHLESVADTAIDRLLHPDGSLLYIRHLRRKIYDEKGILVKVTGISQDITDQTENEIRLQNSEERFRALVQNGSDMTAVLDEMGNIRYISPTSLAISGFAPEELIGRNVFEFMHTDDISLLTTELEAVAKSTNSGEPTLHRFRTKTGSWIWLESKGMNLTNNPAIGGIIINARDVTERKQLEDRLAIEQQNRQRAITSAVIRAQEAERSQVGRELHDNVNQVLTTIKLYTEMMDEGLGDQKELVRKSRQHLQACIDEIRSISKRLSAPTLGEISLDDSIQELVASLNMTNRIEIVYCGLCEVQITQEMHLAIYRIIQEQLNNTLKYAGASLVNIFLRREGTHLILEITDNGKGFDVNAKRTGIGITNMRTRAENLNGQFLLNSQPGKGCRLQVRLPIR